MYHDTFENYGKIYQKAIKINEEEKPVLSSIAERCPIEEVDWGSPQEKWNQKVSECIASIVDVNPYLSIEPGTEVLAVDATSLGALSGLDCRPKIFDGVTKTWKLCDTGSMITVVKKGPEDKIDKNKVLQAVNGTAIQCYGHKVIQVRINRKSYEIKAVIADVEQDIIGWDFIEKHRLSFDWGEFGDLYIIDKKANIRAPLKYVAMSRNSPQTAFLHDSSVPFSDFAWSSPKVEAFEVASMKLLEEKKEAKVKPEEILESLNPKYRDLIKKYPSILTPSFNDL